MYCYIYASYKVCIAITMYIRIYVIAKKQLAFSQFKKLVGMIQ